MGRKDMTQMGGCRETFPTTVWQDIAHLRDPDAGKRREALNRVLAVYWKPVYAFLRRKGYDNEAAKDVTQGFFTDVLVKRDLLQQATRSKGKLRTLLLASLTNYEIDAYRQRRIKEPPAGARSVDDTRSAVEEPADTLTPDRAFYRAYAMQIVEHVLAEVEAECRRKEQQMHWALFHARYIEPVIDGGDVPDLPQLVSKFAAKDAAQASNMMITVKRRFAAAFRVRVRQMEGPESNVEQEMRDLMYALRETSGEGSGPRIF